jgi:S1-C subfamily serine protease
MNISVQKKVIISLLAAQIVLLSGCGVVNLVGEGLDAALDPAPTALPTLTPTAVPTAVPGSVDALEAIQSGFSAVYGEVLPSVVNIQVVRTVEGSPLFPGGDQQQRPSLGSGFVWDEEGHIVTNNHVVRGADRIRVTFSDGISVPGELVGTDRDSDLAVIQVDLDPDQLQPVQVADSTEVIVGQLVAAVGNPFGLQGSMTIGVVSALGRSLPVQAGSLQGTNYTIPDIIQTDAPINPGNSGGVLVDMQGRVIGVPTAIRSTSGVNAGIGFVVPSVIVQKVVPVLIETGEYQHPYIGISGTTLVSELAEAMGYAREQRGVLVAQVTSGGPADQAGIQGSDREVEFNGQTAVVGGDIIVQIDDQPVKDFEDLTSYLARSTEVGQAVTVTLLRDQERMTVELELEARPDQSQQVFAEEQPEQARVWLGVTGISLMPEIAEAMNLEEDLRGVLVQEIFQTSPADQAGLQGSSESIVIDGQRVLIGGDIITAVDDQPVETIEDLRQSLLEKSPGDEITLTLIREGEETTLEVTLEKLPD